MILYIQRYCAEYSAKGIVIQFSDIVIVSVVSVAGCLEFVGHLGKMVWHGKIVS